MRVSIIKASTARQAVAVRAQASKGEASAPAINRRELALRSVNLLALAAMFTWGAAPTPSTIGVCDALPRRLAASPPRRVSMPVYSADTQPACDPRASRPVRLRRVQEPRSLPAVSQLHFYC